MVAKVERTKPKKKSQQPAIAPVSARLDENALERLDTLAPLVAPLGSKPSRAMVVRACILTGLDVLETKHAKRSK